MTQATDDKCCDVCGKSLEVLGSIMPSFQIKVCRDLTDPERTKSLAEAMFPYCLDKTYNVCLLCWFGRLGVKP